MHRSSEPGQSITVNLPDMHHFQERRLAKVGWTCASRSDASGSR